MDERESFGAGGQIQTIMRFPSNPLEGYENPPLNPPPFEDGTRVTRKRLDSLALFKDGFLLPDEVRLAEHIRLNPPTAPNGSPSSRKQASFE